MHAVYCDRCVRTRSRTKKHDEISSALRKFSSHIQNVCCFRFRKTLCHCNMRINDTLKRFSLFNCNMRINNTMKRFSLSQKAIQSVQRARIRMQNKATETFELVLPIPGREMRKLIQGAWCGVRLVCMYASFSQKSSMNMHGRVYMIENKSVYVLIAE